MGEFISLKASDGHNFDAYYAPAQGTRKGGVVLIQEIFGVTPHIQELCEQYAAEGLEVLSPAVFDRIEPNAAFGYTEDEMKKAVDYAAKSGVETPMLDIQACVDKLKADGPVGITGFCYGGSLVWMAASRVEGLDCAVGYYGRLIPEHLDEQPKCPVMLHFGSSDKSIPLDAVRQTSEAHPEVKVHIYRAGHGFCSDRPDHYDETACAKARGRTIAFFEAHF